MLTITRHKDALAIARCLREEYPGYDFVPTRDKGQRKWRLAMYGTSCGAPAFLRFYAP